MFVSQAYAQGAGGAGGDLFAMLVPLILILAVFWFLLIRPQQQRAKAHQEMVRAVRRGDIVATSGGVIGKVARVVDDHEVLLEVAENVRMRLQKHAISEVRSKSNPVPAADEPAPESAQPAPSAQPKRKSGSKKMAQKKASQ